MPATRCGSAACRSSPHVGVPHAASGPKEVPLFLPVYPSLVATAPGAPTRAVARGRAHLELEPRAASGGRRRPDRLDRGPLDEGPAARDVRGRGQRQAGRDDGRGARHVRARRRRRRHGRREPAARRRPARPRRRRPAAREGGALRARVRDGVQRRRGRRDLHAVGGAPRTRRTTGAHDQLRACAVPADDAGRRRLRPPRRRDPVGLLPRRLRGGRAARCASPRAGSRRSSRATRRRAPHSARG